MAEVYPRKLQLWETWAPLRVHGTAPARLPAVPSLAQDFAARLFAAETLQPGRSPREAVEPFTLQWYLEAESVRYGRHGRWLPRLLEFGKHSGEMLLGLGDGLGADWVQYARSGAQTTACCATADAAAVIQRNFELRGLRGRFLVADPARLPLEAASIDVVCVNDLARTAPDPAALVAEVYRVLKPGGKVLAVTAARHNVDFWARWCLPWRSLFRPGPVGGCSRRRLRRLFLRFVEHRIHKRHLRRSETPHLFRWLPLPVLERLMGRFLILKAFKPLSAAISVPMAA
ncbi:MAG TPA: class I SAM-dependent methyltransferase [Gemmataceae bacterium]|nr:class I SAM-dependent methyltransferase [Gemmataceae bacterium]